MTPPPATSPARGIIIIKFIIIVIFMLLVLMTGPARTQNIDTNNDTDIDTHNYTKRQAEIILVIFVVSIVSM